MFGDLLQAERTSEEREIHTWRLHTFVMKVPGDGGQALDYFLRKGRSRLLKSVVKKRVQSRSTRSSFQFFTLVQKYTPKQHSHGETSEFGTILVWNQPVLSDLKYPNT